MSTPSLAFAEITNPRRSWLGWQSGASVGRDPGLAAKGTSTLEAVTCLKSVALEFVTLACAMILATAHAHGAVAAPVADTLTEKLEQCGAERGSSMEVTAEGVALRCGMQQLDGILRGDGLWVSTSGVVGQGRFRVKAARIGRGDSDALTVGEHGMVSLSDGKARLVRPHVVEEYSVNAEGIRQDYIVAAKPPGDGAMRLDLEVAGATVEASPEGITLVMHGSGRRIDYRKLHVTDATGKVLAAGFQHGTEDACSIMVDDSSAVYPVTVDPTFSDADWSSSMGAGAWTDLAVLATAVDAAGNLYVGGKFTKLGELTAHYLAKWDGSSWSTLGSQIGLGSSHSVRTLHCIGTDLYVGGTFTTAGGIAVGNVAKWDGSSWHALGSGISGTVIALGEWRGELYAGGAFTHAGGIPANHIARWNGSSWSALGSGLNWTTAVTPWAMVSCLEAAGDRLYVGGTFTTAGGGDAFCLAQWDGSQWDDVGGFRGRYMKLGRVPASWEWETSVNALAVDRGTLYVAAGFQLWKWDGTQWSAVGGEIGHNPEVPEYSQLEYEIRDILVVDGKVHMCGFFYAVGETVVNHAARWNGTGWEALDSGFDSWPEHARVHCMAASGGKIYAGGLYLWAGGRFQANLSCWSEGKWAPIGQGPSGAVKAVVHEADHVYIAGDFKGADGAVANHVASRATGSKIWRSLGGGTDGPVGALVSWNGSIYAGGGFTSAGGVPASNVARWNGISWSPVGAGFNGPVHALATWNGELYAGGAFSGSGSVAVGGIAKWNGSAWEPVGGGTDGVVSTMASAGGDLYVGGFFYTAGAVGANLVARWNGSQWSALGEGLGVSSWFPFVSALAVAPSGDVYAGGFFGDAGGQSAANVARWNGVAWSPLAQGLAGPVNALAVCGNLVYAGGGFRDSGGKPLAHIACWDGSTWTGIGAGVDRSVSTLLVSGKTLHVGGGFTAAGDKYATSFASVAIPVPPLITSPLQAQARVGQAFSYRVTADNAPTSFGARLAQSAPPGPAWPGGSSGLPAGLVFDAMTGLLSGTPSGSGSHQMVISASNAAGTATAMFTLVVETLSPVVSWAQSAGLTGADAQPQATPFDDGVPNLLKFAFNMKAAGPDRSVLAERGSSGLPRVDVAERNGKPVLRLEFLRRRNSNLVYVPERASSLDAFAPMSGMQTVTPIDDAWERVQVVEDLAIATDARRGFARVRVILP